MDYAGASLTLFIRSMRIDSWNQGPFRILFGRHSANQVRHFEIQDLCFHAATQVGVAGLGAASVQQAEHRFPLFQPNTQAVRNHRGTPDFEVYMFCCTFVTKLDCL